MLLLHHRKLCDAQGQGINMECTPNKAAEPGWGDESGRLLHGTCCGEQRACGDGRADGRILSL